MVKQHSYCWEVVPDDTFKFALGEWVMHTVRGHPRRTCRVVRRYTIGNGNYYYIAKYPSDLIWIDIVESDLSHTDPPVQSPATAILKVVPDSIIKQAGLLPSLMEPGTEFTVTATDPNDSSWLAVNAAWGLGTIVAKHPRGPVLRFPLGVRAAFFEDPADKSTSARTSSSWEVVPDGPEPGSLWGTSVYLPFTVIETTTLGELPNKESAYESLDHGGSYLEGEEILDNVSPEEFVVIYVTGGDTGNAFWRTVGDFTHKFHPLPDLTVRLAVGGVVPEGPEPGSLWSYPHPSTTQYKVIENATWRDILLNDAIEKLGLNQEYERYLQGEGTPTRPPFAWLSPQGQIFPVPRRHQHDEVARQLVAQFNIPKVSGNSFVNITEAGWTWVSKDYDGSWVFSARQYEGATLDSIIEFIAGLPLEAKVSVAANKSIPAKQFLEECGSIFASLKFAQNPNPPADPASTAQDPSVAPGGIPAGQVGQTTPEQAQQPQQQAQGVVTGIPLPDGSFRYTYQGASVFVRPNFNNVGVAMFIGNVGNNTQLLQQAMLRAGQFAIQAVTAYSNENNQKASVGNRLNWRLQGNYMTVGYRLQAYNVASLGPTIAEDQKRYLCMDCGYDTLEDEYYMTRDDVWNSVVPGGMNAGMLCIGCLEKRLGRKLRPEDFLDVPVNDNAININGNPKSQRLLDRLGWHEGKASLDVISWDIVPTYHHKETDPSGNTYYYNEQNELHREDGPAMEWANGTKQWYVNGKCHREDGPAMEWANGSKYWYVNGKRHRLDGPAIERATGSKEWWVNGKRHREDGPAYIGSDGSKYWYVNDKLHRLDGPAIEDADGSKGWYVNGQALTEEEFNRRYPQVHQAGLDLRFAAAWDVVEVPKVGDTVRIKSKSVGRLYDGIDATQFAVGGITRILLPSHVNDYPSKGQFHHVEDWEYQSPVYCVKFEGYPADDYFLEHDLEIVDMEHEASLQLRAWEVVPDLADAEIHITHLWKYAAKDSYANGEDPRSEQDIFGFNVDRTCYSTEEVWMFLARNGFPEHENDNYIAFDHRLLGTQMEDDAGNEVKSGTELYENWKHGRPKYLWSATYNASLEFILEDGTVLEDDDLEDQIAQLFGIQAYGSDSGLKLQRFAWDVVPDKQEAEIGDGVKMTFSMRAWRDILNDNDVRSDFGNLLTNREIRAGFLGAEGTIEYIVEQREYNDRNSMYRITFDSGYLNDLMSGWLWERKDFVLIDRPDTTAMLKRAWEEVPDDIFSAQHGEWWEFKYKIDNVGTLANYRVQIDSISRNNLVAKPGWMSSMEDMSIDTMHPIFTAGMWHLSKILDAHQVSGPHTQSSLKLSWEVDEGHKVLKATKLPEAGWFWAQEGELVLPELVTEDFGFHGFMPGGTRKYSMHAVVSSETVDFKELAENQIKGFCEENNIWATRTRLQKQQAIEAWSKFIEQVYGDVANLQDGTVIEQIANPEHGNNWFKIVKEP